MNCDCGHDKKAHIYEEGACRPGFLCSCKHFTVGGQVPESVAERLAVAIDFLEAEKMKLCAANRFGEAQEYAKVIKRIQVPVGSPRGEK